MGSWCAWQASAQSIQILAHSWQWSCWCLPHSAAQRRQISSHKTRYWWAITESLCNRRAPWTHMSAQSRSRLMQPAIILTSSSCRHSVAQCSQAKAQFNSFWIIARWSWFCIMVNFKFYLTYYPLQLKKVCINLKCSVQILQEPKKAAFIMEAALYILNFY